MKRLIISVGAVMVVLVTVVSITLTGDRDFPSVDAQGAQQTWQVFDLREWDTGLITGSTTFNPRQFVEQLPAECNLVPDPHSEYVFYYGCPMAWEPTSV